MEISIDSKMFAVLFYKGESISFSELSKMLDISIDEVKEVVSRLRDKFVNSGIVFLVNEDSILLGTDPVLSPFLDSIKKEEYEKELSKQALETLSIILYKKQASRSEIDYIRGVQSQVMLRTLSIRGLIEKVPNERGVYRATFDLFRHLGITDTSELPEYDAVLEKLKNASVKDDIDDIKNKEVDENIEL